MHLGDLLLKTEAYDLTGIANAEDVCLAPLLDENGNVETDADGAEHRRLNEVTYALIWAAGDTGVNEITEGNYTAVYRRILYGDYAHGVPACRIKAPVKKKAYLAVMDGVVHGVYSDLYLLFYLIRSGINVEEDQFTKAYDGAVEFFSKNTDRMETVLGIHTIDIVPTSYYTTQDSPGIGLAEVKAHIGLRVTAPVKTQDEFEKEVLQRLYNRSENQIASEIK